MIATHRKQARRALLSRHAVALYQLILARYRLRSVCRQLGLLPLLFTLSACSNEQSKGTSSDPYVIARDTLPCAELQPGGTSWQSAPITDSFAVANKDDPGNTTGSENGTSPSACTWPKYPGISYVRIEHGLQRVPSSVLTYISFEQEGSYAALAAGDLAILIAADAQTITLQNRTHQTYFVRVVLE